MRCESICYVTELQIVKAQKAIYTRVLNTHFPFQFANNVFRTFDKNGDKKLDFREFMTALHMTSSADPKERLMWAFEMYDINGSGQISMSECKDVVKVPRFTKIFS